MLVKAAFGKSFAGLLVVHNSLARISQGKRCIGPKNLRNFFCYKELSDSWTGPMQTDCISNQLEFEGFGGHKVVPA